VLNPAHASTAPVKFFSLDETSACQAHASLHYDNTTLAEIITGTEAGLATGPVTWQVTITPRNVHCIESLLLMAGISGCELAVAPAPELNDRERAFLEDVLAHCGHPAGAQQKAAPKSGPGVYLDFARAYLKVLPGMLPAVLRRRKDVHDRQFRHATLIGGYGSEHIGDIAGLGGVLLRLQQQFGVCEASLFSHRPEYTRRLAAHLDTPVKLEVLPWQPVQVQRELKKPGLLVRAGGQIMDMPPAMLRQLGAIYTARRRGRPVLLEGVEIGPFQYAPSRWVARRIVQSADRITLHTTGAAQDPVLEQLDISTAQDPAFDYLATRGKLSRLAAPERKSVDALLENTEDHIIVGINMRPLQHFSGSPSEPYSRTMEERIFQHLAVAMTDYARLAPAPVTYIFFPVNLLQDGNSDLAAAWRLHRMLHRGLDLRVWEADPDIDAVLYLLRNLDMALAMRFHACIFAMSQGLPTIGIDYDIGAGGKVLQLFRDRELVEDVRRLNEADIHFMVERLLKNQPGGNNHPDMYP
jgi:polysaccharide pyruvyl transferase WcaK-like protein